MKFLGDKKLRAVLGGILIALGSALAEKIGWGQAVISVVVLILGYLGIETGTEIARMKLEMARLEKDSK